MGNCVASPRLNKPFKRKYSGSDQKLLRFHGFGSGISKNSSQLLPPDHEPRTGEAYHFLPLGLPQFSCSQDLKPSVTLKDEMKEEGGSKKVKVVLTKQQLQKLLSMNISLEELIFAASDNEEFSNGNSRIWKPELDTILEGNE